VSAGTTNKKILLVEASKFLSSFNIRLAFLGLYALNYGIPLYYLPMGSSLYGLANFLSELPTGIIADKVGHKKSTALAYLISSISLSLLVINPSPLFYVLSALGLGFGASFESGSLESYVYEASKEDGFNFKKSWSAIMGYSSYASSLAAIISIFISIFSANNFTANLTIIIEAVFYLVACILMLSAKNNKFNPISTELKAFSVKNISHLFAQIRTNSTLKNLTITSALTYLAIWFILGASIGVFYQRGLSVFWISLTMASGYFLAGAINKNFYKFFSPKTYKLVLFMALMRSLVLMIYAWFNQDAVSIICLTILLATASLEIPLISSRTNSELEPNSRATSLSLMSFLVRFWTAPMPILLSFILATSGFSITFSIHALILLLAGLFCSRILKNCGCA